MYLQLSPSDTPARFEPFFGIFLIPNISSPGCVSPCSTTEGSCSAAAQLVTSCSRWRKTRSVTWSIGSYVKAPAPLHTFFNLPSPPPRSGVRGDEPGQPPLVLPPVRGLQLPVHVALFRPASRCLGAGGRGPERVLMPPLGLPRTAAAAALVGAAGWRRTPARTYQHSATSPTTWEVSCACCVSL